MIDIITNTPWELSCDADWVTLSNHSGVATNSKALHLKVTVGENATGHERTAHITLSGSGQSSTLVIVQNSDYVDPLGWITAEDASNAMKIGLNLYNTMEAYGDWFDWTDDPIETFQTCWGNPLVTADWFNAVKANGFNAVRIPVTWFPHTDENFQVTEKWMNRVEEVVKYGLDAGLYVILNVHHDTNGGWLDADLSNINEISEKYVKLWKQIATRFEKYDDHLMFEAYNEILDKNKDWVNAEGDAFIAVNHWHRPSSIPSAALARTTSTATLSSTPTLPTVRTKCSIHSSFPPTRFPNTSWCRYTTMTLSTSVG